MPRRGRPGLPKLREERRSSLRKTRSVASLPRWQRGEHHLPPGKDAFLAGLESGRLQQEQAEEPREEPQGQLVVRRASLADQDAAMAPFRESCERAEDADDVLRAVMSVQAITRSFAEVTANMDGRNAQVARVLEKIRLRYVKSVESLLFALGKLQLDKDAALERKLQAAREAEDAARDELMRVATDNQVHKARAKAQELVSSAQMARIEELERDVDYLRGALRNESRDLLDKIKETGPGAGPEGPSERYDAVQLQLEQPLNSLEGVVESFEAHGHEREVALSNMGRLLDVAQYNAKRKLASESAFAAAKLRDGAILVHTMDKGTITGEQVSGFGAGSQDIMEVSGPVTARNLFWRAFNFARCPRCKVEVQKEVTAAELMALDQKNADLEQRRLESLEERRRSIAELVPPLPSSPKAGSPSASPSASQSSRPQPPLSIDPAGAAEDNEAKRKAGTRSPKAPTPSSPKGAPSPKARAGKKGRAGKLAMHQVASKVVSNRQSMRQGGAEDESEVRKAKAALLSLAQAPGSAVLPVSVVTRILNQNKTGFLVPSELSDFMHNLPHGVTETECRPLDWTLRKIDLLLDEKLDADRSDLADGLQLQPLTSFVVEHALCVHGLRRLAEVHVYDLLTALRAYVKKHPRVGTFARFLGATVVKSDKEDLGKSNSILRAFLAIRSAILRAAGAQAANNNNNNSSSSSSSSNQDGHKRTAKGAPAESGCLVVDDRTFVPIAAAATTARTVYETFLPPRKVNMFCKAIENIAAVHVTYTNHRGEQVSKLRKSKAASTGDRTTVRMNMRKAMLGKDGEGAAGKPLAADEPEEATNQKEDVVVDLDVALESVIKVLKVRERHVDDQLRQLFIDGDTDGDGVLTFEEFGAMIRSACPAISKRKIMRMFRDASMRSGGQTASSSLALTPGTFQQVCREYDVIPILDLARAGLLPAPDAGEAQGASRADPGAPAPSVPSSRAPL